MSRSSRRRPRALACAAAVLVAVGLTLVPAAHALDNGLARTPPMGFNDWNAFG
jgi:alpha-galactosidase